MPIRSFLFTPADSERKLAKGLESGAEALILDLEDSVAAANRPTARRLAREFLDEASARYPVDPRKVVVAGFSQGGMMAYSLAMRWPERFAALVGIATAFPERLAGQVGDSQVRVRRPFGRHKGPNSRLHSRQDLRNAELRIGGNRQHPQLLQYLLPHFGPQFLHAQNDVEKRSAFKAESAVVTAW